MAFVIGPNGVKNFVPDDVARSLVGNGNRGYLMVAPEPDPKPEVKATPARARTRRTSTNK